MPNAEATDRAEHIFSLFDTHGSGSLHAGDFDRMGSRIITAAPEADKAAKERILRSLDLYWQTLEAELDPAMEGRIGLADFVATVLHPERFEAALAELAVALSSLGDRSGDGLVTHRDFHALLAAVGFDEPNIESLFDALEPVDGRVLVSAWAESIRDYYHPEKAGIPGDHLVPDARRP
ncbi:calcium-binding protein [Streptacidiphilus sp. 4-A2]|nr:calcium-binding protein [Streptacidiphilus sp. 4-A2]